ncbi:helix-turn-helix domain-containing protein [Lactococcus lactis]|uniref:helix-turn-helix domain-containing protein n=1 Tax=Lactococcus lactis TaxID=1358 RepID=UPI0026E381B7|nr:helix-turn-helix transcriptional regulator [Lactococcus lactis]MDO6178219.1 helix-turn-helix transcriptional regulator [Lactococcus lactis]
MESFSERLIHLRHSNNLTRKQVRESLDINESTYNRWENGSRTPDNETIVRVIFLLTNEFIRLNRVQAPAFACRTK